VEQVRFPIHFCLVSEHAIPNLVPVLDPAFRPQKTVLLVSREMRTPAFHLESVLKERGIPCERIEIADAFDVLETRQAICNYLGACDCDHVALNVTGGTKIMAFAAHHVFVERNLPIFYVHPERDEIVWLHPTAPAVEIFDSLNLEEFLRAHGYHVSGIRREPYCRKDCPLTRKLVTDIDRYAPSLGTLNFLAGSAEHTPDLTSAPLRNKDGRVKVLGELVGMFEEAGMLRREGDRLRFPNEEARFFVNGGWLENHIFETVLHLKDRLKVRDCAVGIEVRSESGTPNEIDIAFLRNNRLHLVECKTRRFSRVSGAVGAGTLYKMDTLRDLGGPRTRSMLASYQDLPPWDIQRARDLHITTLVGPTLRNLEYELIRWIEK